MLPPPEDIRRFNPSSKPRWDTHNDRAIDADNKFLAEARPRSPVFPSIAEALERRRRQRENIAARVLFVSGVFSVVYAMVERDPFGWVAAGFCMVGFIVTCFVAMSRFDNWQGR